MLMQDATIETVISILEQTGESKNPWLTAHQLRYAETLKRLYAFDGERTAALELGATHIFQYILAKMGFETVYGTQFRSSPEQADRKPFELTVDGFPMRSTFLTVNFEEEPIPLPDESLDLVLCCEVIEHMDVDPMFLMSDLNRVLKPGGALLMTTPNCTSSQNVLKILHGYRPHFFMQYMKNRSPYRHNFEYDVHALLALTRAAGFECTSLETVDTFGKSSEEALEFLRKNDLSTANRGDNIFFIGKKSGPVIERWPPELYV